MLKDRKELLSKVKRVVIKVGSNVLTGGGNDLKKEIFINLTKSISMLTEKGYEVFIVSSGAIAAGRKNLGCVDMPRSIPQKQASAAIGQARLMWSYEECFNKHKKKTAQVLLTRDDLESFL